MKSVALSVWIFINLVCFGMCGYFYLIWSQYWVNLERQRLFSKTPTKADREKTPEVLYYGSNANGDHRRPIRLNVTVTESFLQSIYNKNNNKTGRNISVQTGHDKFLLMRTLDRTKKQINIVKRNEGRPRFPNLGRPFVELDTKKYQCEVDKPEKCVAKVEDYKSLIMKEFKRIIMTEGNILKDGAINPYNVQFDPEKHGNYREKGSKELMCELRNKYIRTITALDSPFAALGFGKRIPKQPLLRNNFYNSCAIVASSGSLLGSNLGDFIDSHDLVLRFNHAPTHNFSQDVGAKTTIRIVNSQVVTKKKFKFQTSKLYKNISILAWDPSNYTSTLVQWYQKPDFNMFPEYKRFLRRNPKADVHMLNPRSLWELWDFVQANTPNRLRKNPPSSGFLGLALLLPRCSFVDVFEYIPSARLTARCHYYGPEDDAACTFGVWHPLAAEKVLAYKVNGATDFTVFQAGYLRVQGYQHLDC